MRRGCVAFLALASTALGLVGCGRFAFEPRAAWRTEAEEACLSAKLVQPTAYMARAGEIDGPGTCGMVYPFRVSALGSGSVGLSNKLTLACPIIPEVDGWLSDTVQPAAELYFGLTVTDLRAGSYSCRGRNNQPGAKTSEHAYGNAVDVMAFKLSDGRWLSVEKGWRGEPAEADFLREVFLGACRHFTTVLAPGSDVFHYNHLHLDLARHDPRGRRRICKPILKFEPRLDPDRASERPSTRPRPAIRPLPEPGPPLDPADDEDPYAVSRRPDARPATRMAGLPPGSGPAPAGSVSAAVPARAGTVSAGPAPAGPALAGPGMAGPRPSAGMPARPLGTATAGAPAVVQPQLWEEEEETPDVD